ncbi:hypothetical protein [Planctobacterium marinum]|uniref:hypothetical protein n=2 Tax=Planctobacterium marinum TaxID=1631968 RepID=UPI0030DA05F8|nr:hypothetical protein [Planctobacterium marinum]
MMPRSTSNRRLLTIVGSSLGLTLGIWLAVGSLKSTCCTAETSSVSAPLPLKRAQANDAVNVQRPSADFVKTPRHQSEPVVDTRTDVEVPMVDMDKFGNYVATLADSGDGLQRFLISDWPVEFPDVVVANGHVVEGCMSYQYFVRWPGSISLLVLENNIMRLYHWDCRFNVELQSYELEPGPLPSQWIRRSVRQILEHSKFTRVNLNEESI